jgi:hypothetical protein
VCGYTHSSSSKLESQSTGNSQQSTVGGHIKQAQEKACRKRGRVVGIGNVIWNTSFTHLAYSIHSVLCNASSVLTNLDTVSIQMLISTRSIISSLSIRDVFGMA